MWWIAVMLAVATAGFLAIACSGNVHSAITYIGIILSIMLMSIARRKNGNFSFVFPESDE